MTKSKFRKVRPSSSGKDLVLSPKFEDILILVKHNIIYYRTLSKTLKTPYRTIKDRVDYLADNGYLFRVQNSYPIKFQLTQSGIQYLEIYFAELLKEGVVEDQPKRGQEDSQNHQSKSPDQSDSLRKDQSLKGSSPILKQGVKVFRKRPKTDVVSFDSLRFSQTLEDYLRNLPKHYPKDPIFLNKPHYITYKFRIIQQDRFLTQYGKNDKGLLGNQTWCSALSVDKFETVEMNNWIKYQGSIFFHKVRYFIIFTTKHIIIRFPFIFTHNPLESIERIIQMIFIAKRELENRFSTKRTRLFLGSVDNDSIGVCVAQHYSILFTPLSVICDQLGLALEDVEGRLRIDASKDVPETETIHSRFGLDDVIFLFKDQVGQVKNEYGVMNAREDIISSESRISTNEILLNKLNNQCLVLEDQITLTNQRNNVSEQNIELISYYVAEIARQLRDSVFSTSSQFEQIDETVSSLETRLESALIKQRPKLEQVILDFLQSREPLRGFTRNELALETQLKLNSVNPTIVSLKKQGLVKEIKIGQKKGKIFLI